MNFSGVSLIFVDGEDGKYGIIVKIPNHLKVKKVVNKKADGAYDPLDFFDSIGIELMEV